MIEIRSRLSPRFPFRSVYSDSKPFPIRGRDVTYRVTGGGLVPDDMEHNTEIPHPFHMAIDQESTAQDEIKARDCVLVRKFIDDLRVLGAKPEFEQYTPSMILANFMFDLSAGATGAYYDLRLNFTRGNRRGIGLFVTVFCAPPGSAIMRNVILLDQVLCAVAKRCGALSALKGTPE